MTQFKFARRSVIASVLFASGAASQAAVMPIDPANFVANPGLITFSEYSIGTLNPSYSASNYGGSGTAPSVSFGSFFTGQSLGVVGTDCPAGTAAFGCITGNPTGTLSLDLGNGIGTLIGTDTNHTASPVLSGLPLLNGSIAMLFSTNQAGVSFDAGFFNAIGSTRVTAYGSDGALLGSIPNTATGIQDLLIGTDDGTSVIAGLLISFVAPEDAGFTIDNVRFGTVSIPNEVPEPASLLLVWSALLVLMASRRHRTAH